MFHELALEFMEQGHSVTVVTPLGDDSVSHKVFYVDGVEVWGFKSGNVKSESKVKRALSETFMSVAAWFRLKAQFSERKFDAIISYSPSIFFGPLIFKLKKLNSCPVYLVLRDLFPQWAVDAEIIRKGSLIERYFSFFEELSYKQASRIGLMSQNNLELFKGHHKDRYHTEILRNWASLQPVQKESPTLAFRKKLNLEGKVLFFYGGNIGHAQDMPNLMRLARSMKVEPEAHFLFVGQGDQVDLIRSLADKWSLKNFTYLPSIDQESFKLLLKEVDVGLFSLSAKHTTHNFPGKLLGYMANAIPILGSVNCNNDLQEVVNNSNAGIIRINGEDEKLLQAAKILCRDPALRHSLGESALLLLKHEFSVENAARQIISAVEDCRNETD